MVAETRLTRRSLLAGAALAFTPTPTPQRPTPKRARIAITLDLEMSRNFPAWEDTHWDYEKGNLNAETCRYAREAGRRVKRAGGVLHYFLVGRALEQPSVDWLQELVREGHPVGNHTYDHVHLKAGTAADLQYRFQRAPWLVEGHTVPEVIRENVSLTSRAIRSRLKVEPAGFRTPGGFPNGLSDRPDLRRLLRDQGFTWVSSLYPAHPPAQERKPPDRAFLSALLAAHAAAQPFAYPDGLVEVPMSPISDIGAFRTGRWKLEWFLTALQAAVEWTIEKRAVFDFLAHPSCLYVVDPELRSIDLLCQLVAASKGAAEIVSLDAIAATIRP